MNTIYDNTFTLGSTSALTFEAGPGIKIDEPSAGTVRIGTDDDYIVITEETVGTYTVNTTDVNIDKTFTKDGYKPIAWTYKFSNAATINFNQEDSQITNSNGLKFQGYAKRSEGSGNLTMNMKILITWVKVGGNE